MSLIDKMWASRGVFVPVKIRRTVHAVHQGMGIESSTFSEDLAYDLARELKSLDGQWRKPLEDRISGLIEANNAEVERRRVAERVIGQVLSFVRSQDRCNPGDPYEPGLKVIFQSLGYSPS